jgi:drug/metabolite transporter (DMT)-like permease
MASVQDEKTKDRPFLGAVLMIAAMLTLPLADAATKYLSATYSPIALSWARFFTGAVALLPLAAYVLRRGVRVNRAVVAQQTLRAVLIVAAMTLFFAAISRIPLADAVGAHFIGPVVATVLAVLLLREVFSKRKLVALLLGFTGAMVVVQPGPSMNIGFLFALGAGFCYGSFLVATRLAAKSIHPLAAVTYQFCFGALVLAPFAWGEMWHVRTEELWLLVVMGLGSAIANLLTIFAMRLAPAALVAPLVYVELIGATLLGYLVFGDFPTILSWVGIVVIMLAGLLLIESGNSGLGIFRRRC